ncbi:MAG: FtsX-like permease family protein [Acidobacteria bacterium]|nr:FtsX-like permease family protein [Acidobacteriota bacterium]
MKLFTHFIVRHLRREKWRTVATIVGIALGIAVVLAIQMTNASSLRGFERAIETVSGRASLEIVGTGLGLDEETVAGLVWLHRYGQVTPVIEGEAEAETPGGQRQSLRILGVDILRDRSFRDYNLLEFGGEDPTPQQFLQLLIDPKAVVLTEKFARRHGMKTGDLIELTFADRTSKYRISGLLLDEGPARAVDGSFVLMDIAAAQWALARLGRIDRLEVKLPNRETIGEVEQEIRRRLPPGVAVQRPTRRGAQVEKMLEAFHFNLAALSYIALLVGLFLIYNTVSISVITRREEIGTLRAIGVKRGHILALFLAEAAGMAIVGCLLGLALARILSYGAIKLTATTVQSLYIAAAASPEPLGLRQVLLAFGIGLPLALLAAALPALEAARVAPMAAMRGNDRLTTRYRLRPALMVAPPMLLIAGWWMSTLPPVSGLPLFGYGAAIAIVFGAALLAPTVLFILGRVGNRTLFRLFRVEGRLANANIAGSIPRLSISVAALAVSLSMMVAIAVMIGSFRQTVIYWVGQTLQADLYLRPATRNNVATDAPFSPEVEEMVSTHPAVAAVDRFRNFDLPYGNGLVTIGTGEFTTLLSYGSLQFKDPTSAAEGREAMRSAIGHESVVVSESFAIKYGRKRGDFVTLETPRGPVTFLIVAVYFDYSSDRGIIVMDRGTFARFWGEPQATSLTVYLHKGSDPERVREELLLRFGNSYRVFIFTNRTLREEVLRIFDSTFSITYALEVIAIFVAILGVATTLLTLILERRRELAILRLVGADRRQVRKMVLIEAGLIGTVSQVIGLLIGLLLSLLLIYVINVQSFGWTIQFHLPTVFLIQSSILISVATILAGLYPAREASRLPATEQVAAE